MLKKHAQLFEALFTTSDLLVVSFSWVASYWLRFYSDLFEVEKGIPPFIDYLKLLLFVWLIWAFVFRKFGLYKPMRGVSRVREIWKLVRANAFSVLLLLAATFLFREKAIPFSRLVFFIFLLVSTVLTILSRSLIRAFLRALRKRGYNLRYAIIVGSQNIAVKVASSMLMNPELGFELIGCLAKESKETHFVPRNPQQARALSRRRAKSSCFCSAKRGVFRFFSPSYFYVENGNLAADISLSEMNHEEVNNLVPIIGAYDDLAQFLNKGWIDQVIIALPHSDHDLLPDIIASIGDAMVDVKIVPDIHQFIQLGSQVEEFEGLPVVSLASTPLSGINGIIKRIFDFIVGSLILVLCFPVMLVIALLVRLSSRGPVFFAQERVGLDGKKFSIYKFRTMRIDAEEHGARWAVKDDPRATRLGKFLRKYSLDELPQLFNVILGQMSLVGPRPERPVFITDFRARIPKYMLRHKVQTGMTGWAQINGWRGNTSIEKRIEHDLFYIENWSLFLDIKILFLTLFRCFNDRNAY